MILIRTVQTFPQMKHFNKCKVPLTAVSSCKALLLLRDQVKRLTYLIPSPHLLEGGGKLG